MSDLIDRDALLQDMTQRGGLGIGDWHVFDIITEQPAIDAQPVKHGRWIYNGYDEYPTCSYCNQSDTYAGDYCENCGARMDAYEIAERRAAADDYAEY